MQFAEFPVALLPLDREMITTRLAKDTFAVRRNMFTTADDAPTDEAWLRFGPDFPGEALVMYPRFLAQLDAAQETAPSAHIDGTYVVVELEDHNVVGQIGTLGAVEGNEVEIGYGINRNVEGRGYATVAVQELLVALSERYPKLTVTAKTRVDNLASMRVLEKNEFTRVGVEPSNEGELVVWSLPYASRDRTRSERTS